MIEFVISEVAVAGGLLGVSPIPGRTRHYGADWPRLRDWRPGLVITMTPLAELARVGAGSLPGDLAHAGIGWAHVPVADFGVPSDAEAMVWPDVQAQALAELHGGGRVLVHCFGGCGRSGMAALRLMVAAGEDPDIALTRLRAARPCAVETEAQRLWAVA